MIMIITSKLFSYYSHFKLQVKISMSSNLFQVMVSCGGDDGG